MTQPAWTEPGFALNGDTHLGYATLGDGPPDLVEVSVAFSHVELGREHLLARRYTQGLAAFSRLIWYDRRGSGLSDRTVGAVAIEVEVEDLLAVVDAAGSERPYLYGHGQGGSVALMFAATHPDRCSGVIAYSTPARYTRGDDYPYGWDEATLERFLEHIEDGLFANPEALRILSPSLADDLEWRNHIGRLGRAATTPKQARDTWATLARTDIRHALSSVNVAVLVLHRSGDLVFPVDQSRDLATRLPNGRFVELPGNDWVTVAGDQDSLIAEIQAFVTGSRPVVDVDRQLATVLFTDVVKSTDTVASIGDKRWRQLLDRHDEIVSREIERHDGQRIKSTGDGVLATFNGPARAVRAALAIRDALASIGVVVRAGLHTGEVERRDDDVSGIAVHIGQRVTALAQPGEVLVSRTVTDLVAGSGIKFADRGEQELKGVPGTWKLYAVEG